MRSKVGEIPKMGRVFGLWLFIGGISHDSICPAFTENCGHKILFAQDLKNLYLSTRTMDLSPEQVEEAKILGIGEAFVKCYARPGLPTFKIKTPEFKLEKNIRQEELDIIFNPIIEKFDIQHVSDAKKKAVEKSIIREIDYGKNKLRTKNEMRYEKEILTKNIPDEIMMNIGEKPFSVLKERYSNLHLHPDDGKNIKDEMILQDYIEEYFLKLDIERGRSKVFLSLTQKGIDYLVNKGLWKPSIPFFHGKGGFLHAIIQNEVKLKFSLLGYNSVIEEKYGSGCDVAVYSADGMKRLYAVEISVTTPYEHELNNLIRNLERFERVIVIMVHLCIKKRKIKKKDFNGVEKEHEIPYKTIDDESSLKKANEFVNYLRGKFNAQNMKRIQIIDIKGFNYFIKNLKQKI